MEINWEEIEVITSKEFVNYMQYQLEHEIIDKVNINKNTKLVEVDVAAINIYTFFYMPERNDIWHQYISKSALMRLDIFDFNIGN